MQFQRKQKRSVFGCLYDSGRVLDGLVDYPNVFSTMQR